MKEENGFYNYEGHSEVPEEPIPKKTKLSSKAIVAITVVCCAVVTVPLSAWLGVKYAQKHLADDYATVVYKEINFENTSDTAIKNSSDCIVEVKSTSRTMGKSGGQSIISDSSCGIIWSNDGYVVTSYHGLRGLQDIKVYYKSKEYNASLYASDEKTDIALLKVDVPMSQCTSVVLGDSDCVSIGDSIYMIGDPETSHEAVVSEGIISTSVQDTMINGRKLPIILTNVSVGKNNGGGMFSASGAFLGFSLLTDRADGSDNQYSYVLPSNMLKTIVEELIENKQVEGRVDCDTIGLQVRQNNLIVTAVNSQNTPFVVGDTILEINDVKIMSGRDWESYLICQEVGDTIKVKLRRNNSSEIVTVDYCLEEKKIDK